MDELITLLDEKLICTGIDISLDFIYFTMTSTRKECVCPSCQGVSSRGHSHYNRNFQDLPIQDQKVVITLSNRKMFCDNPSCHRTTFSETFSFIDNKAKKPKRNAAFKLFKNTVECEKKKYLKIQRISVVVNIMKQFRG